MFKKSGIILVALLYLITASGFAMNLHFCGKTIAEFKLNEPTRDCGMSSKCCKTTHLEVKVKDAHQTAYTVFTSINLALPTALVQFDFYHETLTASSLSSFSAQRGPPPGKQPIFLQNRNFRI